jgi:hypothetical protein
VLQTRWQAVLETEVQSPCSARMRLAGPSAASTQNGARVHSFSSAGAAGAAAAGAAGIQGRSDSSTGAVGRGSCDDALHLGLGECCRGVPGLGLADCFRAGRGWCLTADCPHLCCSTLHCCHLIAWCLSAGQDIGVCNRASEARCCCVAMLAWGAYLCLASCITHSSATRLPPHSGAQAASTYVSALAPFLPVHSRTLSYSARSQPHHS